jgi:CopA family copper-resistance protein
MTLNRRQILAGGSTTAALALLPQWARGQDGHLNHAMAASSPSTLTGERIGLEIGRTGVNIGGKLGHAVTVNGTLPAPLIRLREGQNLRIDVTNHLDEDSSIHWHGLLLPFQMDGVPGVSFPGIKPHQTFTYEFPVRQAGTYWYHSHSGLQEAIGLYGPIIIDPVGPEPHPYDREHVLVLSDWSALHPHVILNRLKKHPGYFNRQKLTLFDHDGMSAKDRLEWAKRRMDQTDIADVTGATYTYLINGQAPQDNWTGLFTQGERVRLRIINAAAMTIFSFRIPGLAMSVVSADGQDVKPVEVDEFQIGVAETYDVIVTPQAQAYTIVAEGIDRSGMAVGTLATAPAMRASVPPLRPRPLLGMKDMGMMDMPGMESMSHSMRDQSNAPKVPLSPGVEMIAPMPMDRVKDRGLGLEDAPHRVLTYGDLEALKPNPDPRPPSRSLDIHLTGNMKRFMWSFDGKRFSEGLEPVRLALDERVRIKLINDTMMTHPIHLHGHFFEVVNGKRGFFPRKHTVNVLPGGYLRLYLTADATGDWALHCHLLLHMHAGMFNIVKIRPQGMQP